MGGGIVWTYQIVCVPSIPFGDETFHEGFKVGAGSWIPVFTDEERGAGVRQEKKAHTFLHSPVAQLCAHSLGDIVQSFATGGDLESGFMPVHQYACAILS